MGKNYPGDTGFIVCKSDLLCKKILYLSRKGLFLHVIRNLFFNRRDYLSRILSKYPFPARWDKFPQIMTLIVDVEFCFLSFSLVLSLVSLVLLYNILEAGSFAGEKFDL